MPTETEYMLFKALQRVVELGPKVFDQVFDRQLLNWYEDYRDNMSPEDFEELKYQEKISQMLRKE